MAPVPTTNRMDTLTRARHDGSLSGVTDHDDEVVPPVAHLLRSGNVAGSRKRPPFSASSPNVAGTIAPTETRWQSKRSATASGGISAPAAASLPASNSSLENDEEDIDDDDASSIGDTEDEDESEDEIEDEDEIDGIADDTDYAALIMQIGGSRSRVNWSNRFAPRLPK